MLLKKRAVKDILAVVKDILAVVKDILAVVQHIEARSWRKTHLGSTKRGALTFCHLMLHNANLRS